MSFFSMNSSHESQYESSKTSRFIIVRLSEIVDGEENEEERDEEDRDEEDRGEEDREEEG